MPAGAGLEMVFERLNFTVLYSDVVNLIPFPIPSLEKNNYYRNSDKEQTTNNNEPLHGRALQKKYLYPKGTFQL